MAKRCQRVLGEHPRVVALGERLRHGTDGRPGVTSGQRVDEQLDRFGPVDHPAGGHHLVERREGVACGAPADPHHVRHRLVAQVEAGVLGDPAHVRLELLGRQQAELEVLGPAADGRQHLVRVGGGQDEAHPARGLLERLEQGVGRPGAEHVDLVEDVDLGPPRRGDDRAADEAAHVVDLVVGGGIELEEVHARPGLDRHTRVARTARLAVTQVRAVEGLGQDPRRRRLAGAPRTGEQVGVRLGAGADGVADRADHVVLAADLGEARRAVPAVERGSGHGPILTVAGDCGSRSWAEDADPPDHVSRSPRRITRAGPACVLRWRPGDLRHTAGSAESCCLPALTRFTGHGRTGPGRRLRTHAFLQATLTGGSSAPAGRKPPVRHRTRRGARADDSARLERVCGGNVTVGSNPTLSAVPARHQAGRPASGRRPRPDGRRHR